MRPPDTPMQTLSFGLLSTFIQSIDHLFCRLSENQGKAIEQEMVLYIQCLK